jgi:hypothetical protein
MAQNIFGDIRRFAVINTTEYNEDGNYAIQVVDFDGLEGLGVNDKEKVTRVSDKTEMFVSELAVGDIAETDYKGAYVMRIA